MKKFTILVILALLTIAGTGYAQSSPAGIYASILPAPNPFELPAANTRLSLELTFGARKGQDVNYVPMKACLLPVTNHSAFQDKEIRSYFVGDCGVPDSAEYAVVRVTAYGGTNIPMGMWMFPGAGFYTMTPNSVSDSGGVLMGAWLPAIVFVGNNETKSGTAIVQLRDMVPPMSFPPAHKAFELQIRNGGEAYALVEIVGYTLPKTASPATASSGAMVWKGVWNGTPSYSPGDVVRAINGTWIKTATGWDIVAGPSGYASNAAATNSESLVSGPPDSPAEASKNGPNPNQ